MIAYLVRRLLSMIPVILVVAIIAFSLVRLLPGDPVAAMLGEFSTLEKQDELRRELGLDKPVPVQFMEWAARAARGDLGRSLKTNQRVTEAIAQRFPATLELTILALLFAVFVGLPSGVISAVHPNSRLDVTASIVSVLGLAIPNFFLGILLILLFGLVLRWLPPSGYMPIDRDLFANLRLMILPSVTLGMAIAATIMRQVRSSLLDVLRQEYVLTARSKGLRDRVVLTRHALRNALIPVVTIVGLQVGRLFGGAVIIESVFAVPGVGRLAVEAVNNRDYSVVQGVVLFMAMAVLLSSLVVDIIYSYVDPRIRYS